MKKSFPPLGISYWYIGAAAAVLVLFGVVAYLNHHLDRGGAVSSPTPTVERTSIITPSPTASHTPTPSPSTSSSPTPTASTMPSAADQLLSQFYASYKAKDREKLGTYFSADTTTELRSLHSQLFTGTDLSGNPGGPTLFSNNTVMEYTLSYSQLSAVAQANSWLVTIKETRTEDGVHNLSETTQVTLIQENGSWKIDSYLHQGQAGKYNGFFTP